MIVFLWHHSHCTDGRDCYCKYWDAVFSLLFTAYCMLFDSSVRKSEIHSTMIDKCVQSRRPRRSSLKRMDYQDMKGSPTLLLPVSESGKPGQSFVCISAPKELVKSNEVEMSEEKMSDWCSPLSHWLLDHHVVPCTTKCILVLIMYYIFPCPVNWQRMQRSLYSFIIWTYYYYYYV